MQMRNRRHTRSILSGLIVVTSVAVATAAAAAGGDGHHVDTAALMKDFGWRVVNFIVLVGVLIWAIKKDRTIRLNIFTIISLVALFSLYFEFYLPKQSTRYTGDLWDVVCYFLGGMLFYFLQNIPSKKHRKISFIAKKRLSLK